MKISELPVGTVIDIEGEGRYEQTHDGLWSATTMENDTFSTDFLEKEYADKVRILSVPFGLAWQLAIMLSDEYDSVDSEGEDITLDGIISDASKEFQRALAFDATIKEK